MSRIPLPGPKRRGPESVASNQSGFVILAYPDTAPFFWISPNGSDWDAVNLSGSWAGGRIDEVINWNGQFLGVGVTSTNADAHAAFWTSDDGRAWQELPDSPALAFFIVPPRSSPDKVYIAHVEVDAGDVVAVGEASCQPYCDGLVAAVRWRSSDGVNWIRRELRRDYPDLRKPVRVGDRWVRIEDTRGALETSLDQQTWENAWRPYWSPGDYYAAQIYDLEWTSFGLFAVGEINHEPTGDYLPLVLNSTDGLTWTRLAWPDLEPASPQFLASNDDLLVMVGYGGNPERPYVWLSTPLPGAPWTTQPFRKGHGPNGA
ncbi:MAG: hypothetical protein QFC55_01525 [Chloroflexota bacterium]|nr:hypothetical protein [Chloroflexota bacterium]